MVVRMDLSGNLKKNITIKLSLTYLRGLEVEDLKEEDMPMI